jgi:glycerate dehydrogenase
MRGVFLDWATVSNGDVSPDALGEVLSDLTIFPTSTAVEVLERVRSAEVVVTNKVAIDQSVLEAAPNLRLICIAATGFNNVAIDRARDRAIAVCNIRNYCTDAVAQHTFSLILALNQKLAGYQQLLQDGTWEGSPQFCLLDFPIRDLRGRCLVIVGYGTLGRRVGELAAAFGMRVRVAARPGTAATADRPVLADLLGEADVLSLHCPLTDATRGLIDARALAMMKRDALIVNTARGALIDSDALANALRAGHIGGAGIDVLPQEPPVDGDSLLLPGIPNLIITPHVAWASVDARQRAVNAMAANIRAFGAGQRENRVD